MLVILSAAACGSSGDSAGGDKPEVAIVTAYYGSPAPKRALDLYKKKAEKAGWKVTLQDSSFDFNKQNSLMQDAITRGVDLIVFGFGDPAQIANGLKSATEAGIPVVGIDAGAKATAGIAWNGTSDNPKLGEDTAKELADKLGNKGSIVIATYTPHAGVRARTKAAVNYFKNETDIKVIGTKEVNDGTNSTAEVRAYVRDIITSKGKDGLDGVWTGFDAAGLGAVQGLDDAGVDVPVTSVDGEDFAIKAVKDPASPWFAVNAQDWDAISTGAVAASKTLLDGGKPDNDLEYFPGDLLVADGK